MGLAGRVLLFVVAIWAVVVGAVLLGRWIAELTV